MRAAFFSCFVMGLAGLWFLSPVEAQQSQPIPLQDVPAEAAKYHDMILRRPQAGVVFDRFYEAWLGAGTVEGLRGFLEKRAAAPAASTADQLVLALFYSRQGLEAEALGAYGKALERDAGNAPAWAAKARLEASMQHLDAAITSLERGLAANPDGTLRLEMSKQRARHLLRQGRQEEALKAYQDILSTNPEDEDLAEEIVYTQMEEGLLEEAAKGAEALVGRTKDAYVKVTRLLLQGDIRERQGSRDLAGAAYEAALLLTGQDTWVEGEVLSRIEQSFRREDDLEGLASKLKALSETQPTRIQLSIRHALVLANLGKLDEAIATYRDLLARTPGQLSVREGFLDLLENAGKYPEAIEQAKALREQNASDKEWIIRLASLQHRAGNDDAAQASLKDYLAGAGNDESEMLRVARLLETWDLKEPARAAYEALVKAHAGSLSARESQAQFLHRIDERDAGLAIWRDIADKGTLEDALHVAQTLGARLEHEVALEVLEARLSANPREPRLLAALCIAAAGAREPHKAIPWARERVRLATRVTEVEDSVKQASMIIRQADAVELVSKELSALPSPAAAERCLLSELREAAKDPKGAEAALSGLTGADEALGLQQMVRLLQSRQEWPRAAAAMEKLVGLPGGNSSTNLQTLVDLHHRSGQGDQALKWIQEWKKVSPGAVTPWTMESRILAESSRSEESIKVLREALRKFPDNAELAAATGDQLVLIGQAAEAMQIFESWYEKAEDVTAKIRWASSLARAAMSDGSTSALVDRFRERQKKNRQSIIPWIALAEIHRAAGNAEARRVALREAANLRPQDLSLLMELAKLQEEDGLWKEALATLETARPLDKTTAVRERQASVQLRYGDEDAGYRILFELAGAESMDARSIERMADGIAARGEWERLSEFLTPLLQKHPRDYRLRYLAAVALEESGRESEAITAFLQLMQPMEELPGVVVPPGGIFAMQVNLIEDEVMKKLPEGTLTFFEISQVWQLAYKYRQSRNNTFYISSLPGSTPSGFVPTPPFSIATPSYAAVHLIGLAQDLNAASKAEMVARLKRMDMSRAEMFLNLTWNPREGGVTVDEEWLKAHPDEKAALAWWTLNSAMRSPNAVNGAPELLRVAFDSFRETNTGLAVAAAMAARNSSDAASQKLFSEGIVLFSKMERLDIMAAQAALTLLQQNGGTNPLTAEEEDVLFSSIKRQIVSGQGIHIAYKDWLVSALGRLFVTKERWADAVALAESDQERFETPGKTSTQAAQQQRTLLLMGGGHMPVVSPLPFPFEATRLSPGAVALFLPSVGNVFNPQPEEPGGLKATPRNEPLLKAAASIKHDTLRQVALLAGGDRESFTTYLDARLKAEADSPAAILLAAWAAQQMQDFKKSVALLLRAHSLTLSSTERNLVEQALLYNAIGGDKSKPEAGLPPESLEAIRNIGRRLARNTSLTTHQKQQLSRPLQALGLSKEASQLRNPPTVASVRRPTSSGMQGGPAGGPSAVEQLMGKNLREAAAREASKQLRIIIPEILSNGSRNRGNNYELWEVIKKHKLTPEILKVSDPGKEAGSRRLVEFAALHELLEMRKEAQELYSQVLVKSPRNMEAMQRLISLLAAQDPEQAAAKLVTIQQPTAQQNVLQSLVYTMQMSNEAQFVDRLNSTRTLTLFMEHLAKTGAAVPREIYPHLISAPRALAQPHYNWRSGGATNHEPRLPDLFASRTYGDGEKMDDEERAGSNTPQARERREVFENLCTTMQKLPELAECGFSAMAGLHIAEKKDLSLLRDRANACVLLVNQEEIRQRVEIVRRMNASFSSGGSEVIWQPKPVEFLIYDAWKAGESTRLESDILPKLAGTDGKETPAQSAAKSFARLWFGKPEEFTEAAEEWAQTQMQNSSQAAWIWFSDGGPMENVLRFASERKLDAPLENWIIKKVAAVSAQNNHVDLDALKPYLRILSENGGNARILKFTEELGDGIFGDAEARKQGSRDFVASRFGRTGTHNAKSYNYGRFIENLLQERLAPIAGLSIMLREGWLDQPRAADNVLSYLDDERFSKDQAALATLLSDSPLGGAPDSFRAYATSRGTDSTVLGTLLSGIRGRGDERSGLLQVLKSAPQRNFGVEFSIACLEEQHDVHLLSFVRTRHEEIAKMTPAAQDEVRATMKQIWPALKRPESMPPDRQAILRPLFAAEMQTAQQRREQLMKASSLDQFKMQDRAFSEFLRSQVLVLVGEKKEAEAIALFEKACSLIEKKMAATGWDDGQNWNGWSTRSQVADAILDWRGGWDLIGFGVRLYNADTSGLLQHPGHPSVNKWNDTLQDAWVLEGGAFRPEEALHQVLSWLQGTLKDAPSAVLSPLMDAFAGSMRPPIRAQLIAWAEKEGPAKPYAALARQFAVAARFHNFHSPTDPVVRAADGSAQPNARFPSMRPEDWDQLRKVIKDESLNPRVRLVLANWVCFNGRHEVDEEIVRTSVTLSTEALRKSWTYSAYHLAAVVRCFNQVPVDDPWRKQAADLWDAWLLRNSRNQEPTSRGRAYKPADTAVFAIWEMAVRARQKPWQTRLRTDFPNTLNDNYLTFVAMVRQGDHQGATEFLRTQWRELNQWVPWPDTLDTATQNSTEVEGQASIYNSAAGDQFVAACADPVLAALGRVFMDVGNDPPVGYRNRFGTLPDYRTRRMQAGATFDPGVFKDELMQQRAAGWFFAAPSAHAKLEPVVSALAAKLPLASLKIDGGSQKMRWEMLLPLMHVHNQALAGNIKPFEEFYKGVRNHATVTGWQKENALAYAGRMALSRSRLFLAQQPPANASQVLPVARVIVENYTTNDEQQLGDALGVFVACHLYDGDKEGLAKWRASLKPDQVTQFIGRLRTQGSLFLTLGELCGRDPRVRLPLERRLALVEAAVTDDWLQEMARKNPGASFKMSILTGRSGILSQEELVAHGMKIAALIPREGRSYEEMAQVFEQRGMEKETLAALDAAIAIAGNNKGLLYPAQIRKAELLHNLGRHPEALSVLAGMELSRLSDAQKWKVERVRKKVDGGAKDFPLPQL